MKEGDTLVQDNQTVKDSEKITDESKETKETIPDTKITQPDSDAQENDIPKPVEILPENDKQQTADTVPDSEKTQSTNTLQETQNPSFDIQKEILSELKRLNEGTTEFKGYIEERNKEQDETQAKEKEAADSEKEETTDSYTSLLSALTDLSSKFDTYTKQNEEILTYMENIEFNTSYGLAFDAVLVGFLSLVAGIFFGRIAFRKL